MKKRVYLDHIATTPLDSRVKEAMEPYLSKSFGNPQSLSALGQEARQALDEARGKVAGLINATPGEIIFTSSGTEANNLALKGVAFAHHQKGGHIIVSSIEHYSVLHPARTLRKMGFEVSEIGVDKYGLVDPQEVKDALGEDTILVSIQLANPEVGTIQPISKIAKLIKDHNRLQAPGSGLQALLHADACCAAGLIPIDVEELGVDLLSLSSHQFYGPKGVGALYLRSGVRIMPLIEGGIQEGSRRAGTEPVAEIVGMGEAARLAMEEMEERSRRLLGLRDRLIKGIREKIDEVYLNGHPTKRLPNNVNMSIRGVEGESLVLSLDMEGISCSTGSACTSHALKASPVLTALKIGPILAQGSLLFTLGKDNTEEEIDFSIEKLPPIVKRLREMSPIYQG